MTTHHVWRKWSGGALAATALVGMVWLTEPRTARAGENAPAASASTDHDDAFQNAWTHVKVRTELLTKLGWDALHVDVDVHGPDVVLSGTVEKRSTEKLAKQVALSVEGVKDVQNDVRVEHKGPEEGALKRTVADSKRELGDALLEARVEGRLFEDIGRAALHVRVEAANGVVSLRGTVPTDDQRDLAVRTAERTKGVVKVVDLIRERSS
jgi:osmotically-inducible protein OsmY